MSDTQGGKEKKGDVKKEHAGTVQAIGMINCG